MPKHFLTFLLLACSSSLAGASSLSQELADVQAQCRKALEELHVKAAETTNNLHQTMKEIEAAVAERKTWPTTKVLDESFRNGGTSLEELQEAAADSGEDKALSALVNELVESRERISTTGKDDSDFTLSDEQKKSWLEWRTAELSRGRKSPPREVLARGSLQAMLRQSYEDGHLSLTDLVRMSQAKNPFVLDAEGDSVLLHLRRVLFHLEKKYRRTPPDSPQRELLQLVSELMQRKSDGEGNRKKSERMVLEIEDSVLPGVESHEPFFLAPGGKSLIVAGKRYELPEGKYLGEATSPSKGVLSPDGSRLASFFPNGEDTWGDPAYQLVEISLPSFREKTLYPQRGDRSAVMTKWPKGLTYRHRDKEDALIVYSPGSRLLAAQRHRGVEIWDTHGHAFWGRLPIEMPPAAMAFDGGENNLIVFSKNRELANWDLASGSRTIIMPGAPRVSEINERRAETSQLTRDGRYLCTAARHSDTESFVQWLHTKDGWEIDRSLPTKTLQRLRVSDDARLVVGQDIEGHFHVWRR